MALIDIKSMSIEELKILLGELGEPTFRAKQIFDWVQVKMADDFSEMTNLSKGLREKLSVQAKISKAVQLDRFISKEDGTEKFLFEMESGAVIESVLMRFGYGNTACISTQAGCRMGCTFCASTLDGMLRNLTAGEMLSQIMEMQKAIGGRISNIVLMGSGEPLDNYENVLKFIALVNDPDGMAIGARHITLSTCGLVERIEQLEDSNLQITLAVSLHAPNDVIRNKIMPISRKNPIELLLSACKHYSDTTKRRITFEYALIHGVNDSDDCAYELVERLRNMLCHVNLIPINDVAERGYKKSSPERVEHFAQILGEKGINVTIRRKLGSDINAACGQLRRGHMNA